MSDERDQSAVNATFSIRDSSSTGSEAVSQMTPKSTQDRSRFVADSMHAITSSYEPEVCRISRYRSNDQCLHKRMVRSKSGGIWSYRAHNLIESFTFRTTIGIIILLNFVEMGCAVQFTSPSWSRVWLNLERLFTLVFVMELVVKLYAWKIAYFQSFLDFCDFVVAIAGIYFNWISPLLQKDPKQTQKADMLSLLRLLRLLRMIRIVRVHRQLLIVVDGITGSLSSMYWVGVLLAVIVYSSSIFCVDFFGEDPDFHKYFGDLPRSMLSLFNLVLLDEWSTIVRLIFNKYWYLVPLFIGFVVFTTFGVVNVLIGTIVESTNAVTARLREEDELDKTRHKEHLVSKLIATMSEMDIDGDSLLSIDEIWAAVRQSNFSTAFHELDFPEGFTVLDLFNYLDTNADNSVSSDEFVDGMYRIIHNSPIQNDTLVQVSLVQIKKLIKQAQEETLAEMRVGFHRILSEIHQLQVPRVRVDHFTEGTFGEASITPTCSPRLDEALETFLQRRTTKVNKKEPQSSMKDTGMHVSSLAVADKTDPRTSSPDTLMRLPWVISQESEMASMNDEVPGVQDNSDIIHTGQSAFQIRRSATKGSSNGYSAMRSRV